MSKNKSDLEFNPEDYKKINELKSKRKWKQIAKKLNQPELENEEEEEEKFISNVKEGANLYQRNLKHKYDEFGIEFTAFNMNEEMEEGNIDESGHYVFSNKKDYDPWYESVKEDVKKKEIKNFDKTANNEIIDIVKEGDDKDYQYYGEEDLYYKEEKISKDEIKQIQNDIKENRIKLIDYLSSKKETVTHAITRLNPKSNHIVIKPQRKKQKIEKVELEIHNKEQETKFKELLDLVSKLTELSYFDVYSDTHDKIEKDYGVKALMKWNYRTISSNEEPQIYGPFSTNQIRSWVDQKLLKDNDEMKIEFCVLNLDNKDDWYSIDNPLIKELLCESESE